MPQRDQVGAIMGDCGCKPDLSQNGPTAAGHSGPELTKNCKVGHVGFCKADFNKTGGVFKKCLIGKFNLHDNLSFRPITTSMDVIFIP